MNKVDRAPLLALMNNLEEQGINCHGCPGNCCTFVANSMQITRLEAQEILNYLKANAFPMEQLQASWQDCIAHFRLDKEFNRPLRQTYTCPFFAGKALGCQLPITVKPLGCLAFNPKSQHRHPETASGLDCTTYKENYPIVEPQKAFPHSNKHKLPIPVALLELATTTDNCQISPS